MFFAVSRFIPQYVEGPIPSPYFAAGRTVRFTCFACFFVVSSARVRFASRARFGVFAMVLPQLFPLIIFSIASQSLGDKTILPPKKRDI